MKKLLLVVVFAFFSCTNAQEFNYGVKAGFAASQMTVKPNDLGFGTLETKYKPGFYVGGFGEYKFNDKMGVQAELQYSNLGGVWQAKVSESGVNLTMDVKNNFNQVLIPVSFKYYVTPKMSLYAGSFAGFKTSVKSDIEISGIPAELMSYIEPEISNLEKELEKELDANTKSAQLGLFLGTDFTFYKGLFLDARYSFGLTNWVKDPQDGEESKMSFFQIGLGYKF